MATQKTKAATIPIGEGPASEETTSSTFEPDADTKITLQGEIIELLRQRGPYGITRIEAPRHLVLSMPARICELRKLGYRITSERVRHGGCSIARYVLVDEPNAEEQHEPNDGNY